MLTRKFIEQQESMVPEHRRLVERVYPKKPPRRRGRKKSPINLALFLFFRRAYLAQKAGKAWLREEFAECVGIPPQLVSTLVCAFHVVSDKMKKAFLRQQKKRDESFCKPENLTAVPILKKENILKRDFNEKDPLEIANTTIMIKDTRFGDRMHYFGFIMEDNCMLHDGICKGDRIIASTTLRPTHGDLVACTLPGLPVVTVRRYARNSNPSVYDLYEGGTTNPMPAFDIDDLILGVVVGVQRTYLARRLPPRDIPEKYLNMPPLKSKKSK